MKKIYKSKTGITLITLVVAVSIMIIISSLLIYNARTGIKVRNYRMMQNDIELLDDKVSAYYMKYGALPVEIEYNVSPLPFESVINLNDNENYYVLDLKVFEGLTLNYGSDYDKVTDSNVADFYDLYIINEQSHQIYYARGIEMDGVMYYTNDIAEEVTLQEIPEKEITVENCTYTKIDTGYEITLENVVYNNSYNLKYKEAKDNSYTEVGQNITTSNYTFNVSKYGLYYIQIEDQKGKTKEIINSVYAGANINNDEKVTMVKNIESSSVTTDEVALIDGFTISGAESECAQTLLGVSSENEKKGTIDDGLVIYLINDNATINWNEETALRNAQEKYDQFVWVPVKNAVLDLSSNAEALASDESIKEAVQSEIDAGRYPMAIKKDATNYFGILYQFEDATDTDGNNYVKVTPYSSWKPTSTIGRREPAYLTDSNWADGSSYNNTNPKVSESLLQSEFNTMVTRVANKGGFWVGRYETSSMVSSNTQDTTNRVTVIRGTTTGINKVNWYRMYAQQKTYKAKALTESANVTSSMIWGSQWEQIMIWMKEVENEAKNSYYVINSLTMGNYRTSDDSDDSTSAPAPTGNSENYKVKNVFDLAGNVYEWTLEANFTDSRVYRGGGYFITDGTSADNRYYFSSPDSSGSGSGTRTTLY